MRTTLNATLERGSTSTGNMISIVSNPGCKEPFSLLCAPPIRVIPHFVNRFHAPAQCARTRRKFDFYELVFSHAISNTVFYHSLFPLCLPMVTFISHPSALPGLSMVKRAPLGSATE